MKLDQNEFPDLRNAFPPVPDSFMERIKETLDKVADEEPAPRFRLPKSPLLIAAILILSLSTVAVALSLLGWTDFFADYNVQMTVATQQALQHSEPHSFTVGPLTFTFQEYFTDGRVVLGSTSVTATDSKATFVSDGIDIPVSADLSTPCYRVRAILDVDPQYRDKHPCMEEVLFSELGQPVYFNMLTINPTTDLQEVPVTYQMFAWQIDPKTGSVIDQWTAEAELTIPVTVLKGTYSYTTEDVFVSSGYELKNVTADLTAAGVYHPFTDWREASSGDIIGGFTTFYGEQQGKGKAENREHNILLACERINDSLIEIDASFSFNELCAPYKKFGGYKIAPNVSQDGEGYGGGVCQVTTTLYNAVLTLPLQITDWAIHRYNGVSYVPQFFDAAVGTYSDFVFTNTLPYAIKIKAIPQNGMLTVLIYCA